MHYLEVGIIVYVLIMLAVFAILRFSMENLEYVYACILAIFWPISFACAVVGGFMAAIYRFVDEL